MSFHSKVFCFCNGKAINYNRVLGERERELEKERLQESLYIGMVGNSQLSLANFSLLPLIRSLGFFPEFIAFMGIFSAVKTTHLELVLSKCHSNF